MVKYFCDRCGIELSEYDNEVNKIILYNDAISFCDDCVKDFDDFLTNVKVVIPRDTVVSSK